MGLKCGIIGLPNVGKSTLFNALTGNQAQAENYPFCTIDPNVGIAELVDERLHLLATIAKSAKVIPAIVEFVDVAGLVKGAHDNAGLGNRFLSHIRETDGVAHVVRCFEDDNVTHVSNAIDPVDDMATINLELMLADLATVERTTQRATTTAKSGDKEARQWIGIGHRLIEHLSAGHPARTLTLTDNERDVVKPLCLMTMKPMLYIANVGEDGFANNPLLDAVNAAAATESAPVVPICAHIEAGMIDWDIKDKIELLQDMNISDTGLARLARATFNMLQLITYFTAGPTEARAWTIPRGSNAQEAAGVIHTDFFRGFIRAAVISCQDFIDCGGESAAADNGKCRQEGRDYIVADGDVIHFRFNV